MDIDEIRRNFNPAVQEIIDLCRLTDDFVDKDMFRVYIATIWGNAVLEPEKTGITEPELPLLHDFLNEELEKVLGVGQDVTQCYEYLVSEEGDEALVRLQIGSQHKAFIHYFARLILAREVDSP